METNAFIKERAKQAVKANYWPTVAVCAVEGLVLMVMSEYTSFSTTLQSIAGESGEIHTSVGGFGLLYTLFIGNILTVGLSSFLVKNAKGLEKPQFMELFSGFKENYGNNLVVMALRYLFTFLWTLLFIIPGIVKAYEYAMIPYLLAEYPGLSRQEAFARSKQLMDGKKMQLFLMHLSFIGWFFLSILTLGILSIFWVDPYMSQAEANFYLAAKEDLYQQTRGLG